MSLLENPLLVPQFWTLPIQSPTLYLHFQVLQMYQNRYAYNTSCIRFSNFHTRDVIPILVFSWSGVS